MQISLKAARVNCNLTQQEAANALGINKETLGNWERGKTFPTALMFTKLCELYKLSPDEIFLTKQ